MPKTTGGPADLYPLPPTVGYENHDVRKQRLPQYSFGGRKFVKDNTVGPGPARYQVDKLVRYGITNANKYSMGEKRYLSEKSKSPGPMAYQLRNSPIYKGVFAPAYSMSKVNTFNFKNWAPGPNIYKFADSTKQRAPAYSIGVKKYLPELGRSPGPAIYPRSNLEVVKQAGAVYSMTTRNNYAFKVYGPGPNWYDRMEYHPGRKQPKYSFGVRHSPKTGTFIVPCDNI